MNITVIKHLVKLVIAFLISLFPILDVLAQAEAKAANKAAHIKIIRNSDGQVQVIDTVVNMVEYAEALDRLNSINVDTAALRKLSSSLSSVYRIDTTMFYKDLPALAVWVDHIRSDTTTWQKQLGNKTKVYMLQKAMTPEERALLLEKFSGITTDTVLFNKLKSANFYINADSAANFHFREFDMMLDSVHFRSAASAFIFHAVPAAGQIFRLNHDQETLVDINPNDIEQIMVYKRGMALHTDSILEVHGADKSFNVITDKKTGEKKIFEVDEKGREAELKGNYIKLNHGNTVAVVVLKTKIKELTNEDKLELRAAGARVETKPRHELEFDDISYSPNPNNGRFNLSFMLEDKGKAFVRILDNTGKEVFTEEVDKQTGWYNREMDISKYGRGIYYLQVVQGHRYYTKKLLVQ